MATLILFAQLAQSQQVLHLLDGQHPHTASLNDMDWLQGKWVAEMGDAIAEELWLEPAGNSMMGVFRMYNNKEVIFMETMILVPEGNSISMKLKHFNKDLTGWEDKDESINFPLVYLEPGIAFFDGLTYQLKDKNLLNVYVEADSGGENPEVLHFSFKRLP
jgi:hypothetical protein